MIAVDGGEVWTDDSGGDGPPLVLLHPGVGDSRIWEPVLPALTASYRVVRYDARGYGESLPPMAAWSQHGDLLALIDELEITRAHLVGESMGAGIVVEAALARPEAVAKQRRRGHLTARERVTALFDDGSFVEHGLLARPALAELDAPADGIVTGAGTIDGRPTAVVSYDYTALGETFDDLGMVVEGINVVGEGLDGVAVARVVSIEAIKGADTRARRRGGVVHRALRRRALRGGAGEEGATAASAGGR